MKIKKRISKPVRTLVTEEDVGELLKALSNIGFEDIYKDDIIDEMESFDEDSYLIFDAKGVYGNVDVIPESYSGRDIVDRNTFLSLAKEPTEYLIIETNPGFKSIIGTLQIGDFFILKNANKNDLNYGESCFTCVQPSKDVPDYNLFEDAFRNYTMSGIIDSFTDPVYRDNTVYFPLQW